MPRFARSLGYSASCARRDTTGIRSPSYHETIERVRLRQGSALPVVAEEVGDLPHGFAQHAHARQVHHAEVVGAMPVERAAVADEDVLVMQQVERELLVRVDVEAFDVDLREDVERGLRLDGGDAGNLVEHVVDEVALVVHAACTTDWAGTFEHMRMLASMLRPSM